MLLIKQIIFTALTKNQMLVNFKQLIRKPIKRLLKWLKFKILGLLIQIIRKNKFRPKKMNNGILKTKKFQVKKRKIKIRQSQKM